MYEMDTCDALQILTETGLSKTAHRVAVLHCLIHACRPLSAGDILEQRKNEKRIDRATLYRMLQAFKEKGIIREIAADKGIFYELACRHNPSHPHFFCRKCKAVACLAPLSASQERRWLRSYRFTVDRINIYITGVCNRCHRGD
ncbi:MAG: Fur family transcriptional regulator [Syntrophales bacterium]